MKTVSWIFQFRSMMWGMGGVLFFQLLRLLVFQDLEKIRKPFQSEWFERNFFRILFGFCFSFFVLAFLQKYSQLESLSLNSQDFWLHVDLLAQMKNGGAFLTRFAPHALGWVQHGSVHPSFSWLALFPILWIFSPLVLGLLFNPLALSSAGWMIGVVSRKKWGAYSALILAFAFLCSTQVGKILDYDFHPEAAYPFLVLLWLYSLGLADEGRVRWKTLILSCLLCAGVKEDSFLLIGPWVLWGFIFLRGAKRKASILSGVLLVVGVLTQAWMVRNWVSGAWGPHFWEGKPVFAAAGVLYFGGHHWSSVSDIFEIFRNLVFQQNTLKALFDFWVSRPWLSLIVLAPWVLIDFRFWFLILPLTVAHSLLEGPRHLWNYYSAPFLASFWFCAIFPLSTRFKQVWPRVYWMFFACLFLGDKGIRLYFPSDLSTRIKTEAAAFLPCLGKQGLVAPHLIHSVPMERILYDRVPPRPDQWDQLDFVLFSPKLGRFELSESEAQALYARLLQDKDWRLIGTDCQSIPSSTKEVMLFRRVGK